jgi:hypothetical protein
VSDVHSDCRKRIMELEGEVKVLKRILARRQAPLSETIKTKHVETRGDRFGVPRPAPKPTGRKK